MRAGALPVLPPRGWLSHLLPLPAIGSVVAIFVSMLTKYARYYFLLSPFARIRWGRLLSISCIAMALITLLPMRLGEMARPAMLRERGKVSGWAVTGTVAAERIMDGVVFGAALLLGLLVAPPVKPIPDHIGDLPVPAALVPRAAVVATAGFGVGFLTMVVLFWRRDLARRLTERVISVVSPKAGAALALVIERTSEGLRFLINPRHTAPYLGVTLISLVANVLAIELLASAVGLYALAFWRSTVVLGVLALGFALPNAPGFFGAVQLALYAGLALYVAPEMVVREGATLVFIYYVAYLGVVLSLALGALLIEYALPAGAEVKEPEAEHGQ
jgi:hypothetical protein